MPADSSSTCCSSLARGSLARGERLLVDAGVGGTLGNALWLAARSNTLELLANDLDGAGAVGSVDRGGVSEVRVDASKELAVGGLDVLHDNMALGGLLAVTAGTVELAEGVNGEAVDGDSSSAVLLDDLVFSAGSSSTDH